MRMQSERREAKNGVRMFLAATRPIKKECPALRALAHELLTSGWPAHGHPRLTVEQARAVQLGFGDLISAVADRPDISGRHLPGGAGLND